jgi:hypothetical protein
MPNALRLTAVALAMIVAFAAVSVAVRLVVTLPVVFSLIGAGCRPGGEPDRLGQWG